jgi:hypothetical protein
MTGINYEGDESFFSEESDSDDWSFLDQPGSPAEVQVQLSGENGNVFSIIGRVAAELRRAGFREEASTWVAEATSCRSYDEVLRLAMRTVDVS